MPDPVSDEGSLLILDTHVWLWTVGGATDAMSPEAVEAIARAGRRGRVAVSAISVPSTRAHGKGSCRWSWRS